MWIIQNAQDVLTNAVALGPMGEQGPVKCLQHYVGQRNPASDSDCHLENMPVFKELTLNLHMVLLAMHVLCKRQTHVCYGFLPGKQSVAFYSIS